MTSFAVKRDIFHSFFGTKEDDLHRQPHDVAKDQGGNEGGDDVMSDTDGIISSGLPAEPPDNEDTQMVRHHLNHNHNMSRLIKTFTTVPKEIFRLNNKGPQSPCGNKKR